MKLKEIEVGDPWRAQPTNFGMHCTDPQCDIEEIHPNPWTISATNRGDDEANLRFFCDDVDILQWKHLPDEKNKGFVDVKIPARTQKALGGILIHFQRMRDGYCDNPDHEKVYSKAQQRYICPFCHSEQ